MYVTAYNTTDQPVTADDNGAQIGGLEFGSVNQNSDAVKLAISENKLVVYIPPTDGVPGDTDPQVLEVVRLTEAKNRQSEPAATRKGKGDK